jgi:MFS family permease
VRAILGGVKRSARLALVLLLAITLLERMGSLAMQASLSYELLAVALGRGHALMTWATVLGLLVGGALAVRLGPRAVALVGVSLAAAGHFALALGGPEMAGAMVVWFGASVARPCLVVVAADVLAWDDEPRTSPPPHRWAAVAAFAIALGGAAELGAMLGTLLDAASMRATPGGDGPSWLFFATGAATTLATIAAAALVALPILERRAALASSSAGPYRETGAPVAKPVAPVGPGPQRALVGLAILFAAGVPHLFAWWPALLTSDVTPDETTWLSIATTATSFLAAVVVFAVLGVAFRRRASWPPLLAFGAALAVTGIGVAARSMSPSFAALAVGELLVSTASTATWSVPVAYAAVAIRGRAATLVVAGWYALTFAVTTLATPKAHGIDGTLAIVGALSIGAGLALLKYGRALHARFFDSA